MSRKLLLVCVAISVSGMAVDAGPVNAQDWLRLEQPLSERIAKKRKPKIGAATAAKPNSARRTTSSSRAVPSQTATRQSVSRTTMPASKPDPVVTGSHRRTNRPGLLHSMFGGSNTTEAQRPQTAAPRQQTRRVARTTQRRKKQVRRTVAPEYLPAVVNYTSEHAAGTIIIDTASKYLYVVLEGGKARRYGVGVGRPGFAWSGTANIGRKAEWPSWRPPAAMRKRQPELPTYMEGGPNNPLGARAMYLYQNGNDTLYRIHGSNEPWTIGHAVSSGCIRMRNEDVMELYQSVDIGTKVVVL